MTIENTINNFSTNIGNAVTLGKHYLTIVNHVIEKRDTTPIIKIHNAAINRNDKDIASAIRFTFGKICFWAILAIFLASIFYKKAVRTLQVNGG